MYAITGTLDFQPGGDPRRGNVGAGAVVPILLGLFVFGIGKAAVMPFHRWLPAAMVAPTPVSALLHAVAVVKAGVFAVLKVTVYIFGFDFLGAETGASVWLMWVGGGHDHSRLAGGFHEGQPQGAARVLHGKPAVLRRAGGDAGERPRR